MKYIIMLPIALAAVCGVMSQASAAPSSSTYVQTIHHCGYLPAQNRTVANHPRNIAILQQKLEKIGYNVGTPGIDGIYGRYTKGAMRHFKDDYNVPVNNALNGDSVALLAYATHPAANVRRCKNPAQL